MFWTTAVAGELERTIAALGGQAFQFVLAELHLAVGPKHFTHRRLVNLAQLVFGVDIVIA